MSGWPKWVAKRQAAAAHEQNKHNDEDARELALSPALAGAPIPIGQSYHLQHCNQTRRMVLRVAGRAKAESRLLPFLSNTGMRSLSRLGGP